MARHILSTSLEDKIFGEALGLFPEDTSGRWRKIYMHVCQNLYRSTSSSSSDKVPEVPATRSRRRPLPSTPSGFPPEEKLATFLNATKWAISESHKSQMMWNVIFDYLKDSLLNSISQEECLESINSLL